MLKYFPPEIKTVHLKRSRGFWSKTFGIAWKILKAKADIYHCHYLLQDCWLALKFGKHPIIGHAHGTDVRSNIKHFAWGRIVRYNLGNCDKIVVSTPNLLETAREFNKSAEYVPNLVDENLFYPKTRKKVKGKIKVLIAGASDWAVKGTDKIIRALKKIEKDVEISIIKYGIDIDKTLKLAKALGLRINVLPPVPHINMPEYYWSADTIVASIGVGGTLGMVALEAIACGRPVITHVSSQFPEYEEFPFCDIFSTEKIAEAILSSRNEKVWKKEYEYYKRYHAPEKIMRKFMEIYNDLIQQWA